MAAMVWRYVSTEEIACVPREHAEDTRNVHDDWKCAVHSHVSETWVENGYKTPDSTPNYPGYVHVLTRLFPRAHREGGHPIIFPPGSNRWEGGSEEELDGLEIIRLGSIRISIRYWMRGDEKTSSAMI